MYNKIIFLYFHYSNIFSERTLAYYLVEQEDLVKLFLTKFLFSKSMMRQMQNFES